MRKFYAVVLALTLLLPLIAAAVASAQAIPYASDVIDTANTKVTVSGGAITAKASIDTKMIVSSVGFPTFCIQEKQDGKWVTVANGAGMASNAKSRTKTITYTKAAGRSYRVKTAYKAIYNGETYTAPGFSKSV